MSIKDIWNEVKQDRINKKEEKKQQKLAKKKRRTGEQKAYIVFWVFFIFFIVGSCVFSSCQMLSCSNFSCDNYNFASLVGISEETIAEIQKDVNKNDVLIDNEIAYADWLKCVVTFNNANLDIITKNKLDNEKLSGDLTFEDFLLTGREIGALYSNLSEIYSTEKNIQILNVNILGEVGNNNKGVIESVVYMSLSNLLGVSNLPNVFVYAKSAIQIIQDKIIILESDIKINNLSEKAQGEINAFLASDKLTGLKNTSNNLICSMMSDFAKLFNGNISIESNGLKFYN